VLNRGFSGYNSRWGASIVKDIARLRPDLVTVFFGANDAVVNEAPTHISLAEYEINLTKIVKEIRRVS
jgi:lysophospholipase L1-like esterase